MPGARWTSLSAIHPDRISGVKLIRLCLARASFANQNNNNNNNKIPFPLCHLKFYSSSHCVKVIAMYVLLYYMYAKKKNYFQISELIMGAIKSRFCKHGSLTFTKSLRISFLKYTQEQ